MLTLKPMSPFLQQRQASMRKMKVKRPEKETATTASDEGHDSSLSGAPSVGIVGNSSVKTQEQHGNQTTNPGNTLLLKLSATIRHGTLCMAEKVKLSI